MYRTTSLRLVWLSIKWQQFPKMLFFAPIGWLWLASAIVWLFFWWQSFSHHIHHGVTLSAQLTHWLTMLVAMMFPLLMVQIRHLTKSSANIRLKRNILWFLFGYSLVWTVLAFPFLGLHYVLQQIIGHELSIFISAGCLLLASSLAFSKKHPIMMAKCSFTQPVSLLGWQADRDCLFYGIRVAQNCLYSCGLPMLALIFIGHGLEVMLLISIFLWYERYCISHYSKQMAAIWSILAILLLINYSI